MDSATRDRLVEEDPCSAEIIKPFVRGEDLRPWYQEDEGRWLIVLKSSGDYSWPWRNADDAEDVFRETYPSLYAHMKPWEDKLHKRQDKGRYWWELRSCAYYDVFEKQKILWPDIAKQPRFSLGDAGVHAGNTVYLAPLSLKYALGVLASRVPWFTAFTPQPVLWRTRR